MANGANEVAYTNDARAYRLAICEVFHPELHGHDENSSPHITSHFLVYTLIDLPDFYNNVYLQEENSLRRYRRAVKLLHGSLPHPAVRNYNRIAKKYIRLEIIQADVLTGQEEVAYLKTFWLRIVQRRWKKVYKERKELLQQRGQMAALRERQRTGKWPVSLREWPLFKLNLLV
jgi:hypothetical protein